MLYNEEGNFPIHNVTFSLCMFYSLFVWRCVHAPHWGHAVSSPLPQNHHEPSWQHEWTDQALIFTESYYPSDPWPDACVTHTWTEPFLNDSWAKVSQDPTYSKRSVRCVCVYPSCFYFYFYYYYLKENLGLQVAGHNLFWSPSVSMSLRFSSNWKRTCSKRSTISLKLPVECFFG